MSFSLEEVLHCLSWFMTVFSVLVGVLAFALRKACRGDGRLMRTASTLFALGAAVLAAVAFAHGIAPPLLLCGVTALVFTTAAVRARA